MQAIGSLIADINRGAEANILLEAQAGVASLWNGRMAGPLGDVLRPEHSLQLGKLGDTTVERGWLIADRSLSSQAVDLVAIQAIVKSSEATAERGLAISENIIGKADARRDQNGRIGICFIR